MVGGAQVSAVLADALQELHEFGLTQQDVGAVVGAGPRTVTRWRRGETRPSRTAGVRLMELAYVAREAAKLLHPDDVNWWLFQPNQALDGVKPGDRIRDGHYEDVLDLLAAMADGAFS